MSLTSYRAAPPRDVFFLQMYRCIPVSLRLFVLEGRAFFGRTGLVHPAAGMFRASGGVEPVLSSWSEVSLFRSGGDLLSHVLRRSTIGVGALIGRVRDGIGSFTPAMTTRPEKRQAGPVSSPPRA